ncbi:MAG: hypothetical protein QXX32_04455 [Thermofilum sp.]|uniref:Cysteine protease n=2 Tax=Thermofilum TaxID=2268 RepID=S5ZG95_9CREN|nr:hypothetical protein [Thermofilum adornatum]AGT36213.1 hypothetical protein N186_09385 [Thermofilum adornatum]
MDKRTVSIILGVLAVFLIALYFIPIPGGPSGEPKLEYKILTSRHIISAAYKVYGRPELGLWVAKVILTNNGTSPIYDLKISYSIDKYSDWVEGGKYPVLLPGSTVVNLYYPIVSSEVAKLTTSTPSKVNIKITYVDARGAQKEITESKSIEILGAHDFIFTSLSPEENTGTFYDIFSNYPLIAAFVTPTDPVVREYADMGNKLAGGAGATLSDEEALKSLSGMWELSVYNGISYKTEPQAFWTGQVSQYVKYPRDVIRDRAGTCLDTAIFFASLAIAQGLDAYVVLMPGHAFTVVVLPQSRQIIPIETTTLNQKVSFEEAVQVGVKVLKEAINGPHYVVDIKGFQALGITPPELETLPPDTLAKWGIKLPSGMSESPSQGSSSGSPGQPSTGGSLQYTNPSPRWSMSYPKSWTVSQHGSYEVDFVYQDQALIVVLWVQGVKRQELRSYFENAMSQQGDLKVLKEQKVSVSGVQADAVAYQYSFSGQNFIIVARYFEYQGYGFIIFYQVFDQNMINTCESIIQTFRLG